MTDETRPPEEELRIAIQQVARAIRSNRSEEMGDSQLSVLIHLDVRGPLTPTELATLEHVRPPSMIRTINGLERAGLVTRTRSTDDARKVIVELTAAARPLLAETRRMRVAWFAERFDTLSADERAALLAVVPLLRRLAGR